MSRKPLRPGADGRREQAPTSAESGSGKPGRPKGKHSDKEHYAQMSLYIRREIRNRTKIRLFEKELEFSELVESLLERWLESQEGSTRPADDIIGRRR